MKKIVTLIVSIALLFSFIACDNDESKNNVKNDKEFTQVLNSINEVLTEAKEKIIELDKKAEEIFSNPEKYKNGLTNNNYELFNNTVYYNPKDTGGCAYFYSGIVPIGDEEKQKVKMLENLEPKIKDVINSSEYFVAGYFNTHDSLNIIYPYLDVIATFEPKMDIPAFNFYFEANEKNNPSKEAVWVKDAYVDPAGNGYMVSVISPVYNNDFLEGVVGIDITIGTIAKNFISNSNTMLMLVDKNTSLLAINESCAKILDIESLKEHNYLETIKEDTFVEDDFVLIKNEDEDVRSIAEKIKTEKTFNIEIDGTKYDFDRAVIPELNWYLIAVYK